MLRLLRAALFRNRRNFRRDQVQAEAVLRIGGREITCRISDVSPGGAFLSPVLEVKVGAEGSLRLPQVPIDTPIRVVRSNKAGIGVEFLQANVGAIVAGWTRGRSPA